MTDDEPLVAPLQWPIGILEEWIHVVGPNLLMSLLLGFPAWWSRQRTSEKVSDVPVSRRRQQALANQFGYSTTITQ